MPETAAMEPQAINKLSMRERKVPPDRGLTAMRDAITQKGEFQEGVLRFLRAFLGETHGPQWCVWALGAYIGALTLALVGVASALIGEGGARGPWLPVLLLGAAAFLTERHSVQLSPRAEISISFLPIVLAAVIYGPLAALAVSVVSLFGDFKAPYARWLSWTASRSLAAIAAGVAASSLGGATDSFTRVAVAVAAATTVEQLGDLALSSVSAMLRGMPVREIAREATGTVLLGIPLYTPLTAVLIYAYRTVSPWSIAFFLVPAFASQKLFLLYREQRATSQELARAIARQERANLSFATALVATLDARDRYTAGHSAAVAVYARDIAKRMGLSEADQQLVHLCGLVHDIGKVGLPPGLLEKPGPLTLDERRQMERHSEIGAGILSNVEDYSEIAAVVRHHHERFDGHGYPDKLAGRDIPLLSRIIAVADAYDAMISDRPYRDAMPSRVARMRLAQAVESQFDTSVVAAFEAVLAGASEEYREGSAESFALTKHAEFAVAVASAATA